MLTQRHISHTNIAIAYKTQYPAVHYQNIWIYINIFFTFLSVFALPFTQFADWWQWRSRRGTIGRGNGESFRWTGSWQGQIRCVAAHQCHRGKSTQRGNQVSRPRCRRWVFLIVFFFSFTRLLRTIRGKRDYWEIESLKLSIVERTCQTSSSVPMCLATDENIEQNRRKTNSQFWYICHVENCIRLIKLPFAAAIKNITNLYVNEFLSIDCGWKKKSEHEVVKC